MKKIFRANENQPIKIKKYFKRILSAMLPVLILPYAVHAGVLGSHVSEDSERIAAYTTYHKNVFFSESVGNQTEHYVEYKPNNLVRPTVANGASAYGKRTVLQAADVLRSSGLNPSAGMNADFFSFQTGVPMSNTLTEGRIFTADSSWRAGIGFRADGTAFCATFPIHTTITCEDGSGFLVECINKYRQPYALYLYNSDFGSSTHSPDRGTDIVLGSVSGELRIGGEVTAVVESISENDGSVPIPQGKMLLGVSASASDELKARLANLSVGQTVTISTNVSENEELWESAVCGIGAYGGKLISNGQPDFEDESAAPRSAVGIKADGSIIFYTLDGRQRGYSYGARKENVAYRLLELGCVEAVSLDGGGSTQMAISGAGSLDFNIVNSPSDGSPRSCANFLFLTKPYPNGIPYELVMANDGVYMLSGSSVSMAVISSLDTSYTQTAIPEDIEYIIEYDAETPDGSGNKSYIDKSSGWLTVFGDGEVYAAANSGEAHGTAAARSVTTPDSITLYDTDFGYDVTELPIEPDTRVNLGAKSFFGGRELLSDNSCYRWTVVSDDASIGTVDENGVFTASDTRGATGTLSVSAGICSVTIPVTINGDDTPHTPENDLKINGAVNGSTLSANVNYSGLAKNNITVSLDGKPADFEYQNGKITCQISDGSYHRICVKVTLDDGRSAISFFDSGNTGGIKNPFSDTGNHWGRDYISYLNRCGVVNGNLEDGGIIRFNPDNNMTRTEFAIMLCNYLGINPDEYADVQLPFTDSADIPWWAENQVKAIYSLKIMQGQLGQSGVSFNPNANINRMEFAISLNRLLPDGLESKPINAADAQDIPFWAEESMKTAVTCGIMTGYPDGTLRPSRGVTRAEAVKMLFNIFGV